MEPFLPFGMVKICLNHFSDKNIRWLNSYLWNTDNVFTLTPKNNSNLYSKLQIVYLSLWSVRFPLMEATTFVFNHKYAPKMWIKIYFFLFVVDGGGLKWHFLLWKQEINDFRDCLLSRCIQIYRMSMITDTVKKKRLKGKIFDASLEFWTFSKPKSKTINKSKDLGHNLYFLYFLKV